ncbi:class III lanthionine synthetase LanKC [Streptomyces sp. GS7]|uniref:class III lanthionine synthetase LanKC n=1 Tax=Streptomyces sp. GS7 TaxID=2692234 RepID=UPI0013160EE8|nr:class III lanthionine synthetase LanKC [Streptomyces sp. GS7]QHC21371.1 phosphotransferase [Streptomyces sp. GS7]
MDKRYENYCMADPVFFEAPGRSGNGASDTDFEVSGRPVPEGWRQHRGDMWLELHPLGEHMLEQGWKVHASGTFDNAERIIETVWEYCVPRRYGFKFLASRHAFLGQNSKYAPRGASGKLVTIYPRDEAELTDVLTGLAALLEGEPGPYILSDARYESGPLYVRYGGFRKREILLESGDVVPAMQRPDGELVPDIRRPVFEVPVWVTPPDILKKSIEARTVPSKDTFPYQILKPLHFSNGGGIYVAQRLSDGLQVVLKEARPHAGLDMEAADAVTRLLRERDTLAKLDGIQGIPRLYEHFTAWDHHFLAIEYFEAERLSSKEAQTYPLLGADVDEEQKATYAQWAMDVCRQVETLLDEIHDRGVVYGDLHPHNILVLEDGRAVLVDFETSSFDADGFQQAMAAPGFAAPREYRGTRVDIYAMAILRLWLFMPLVPILTLDREKIHDLIDAMRENFPVPAEYIEAIRTGLGTSVPRTKAAQAGIGRPTVQVQGEATDWPRLLDSMAAAIKASATPEREDRLFPGDVRQFSQIGETFAFGAAGVLYALRECGYEIPEGADEWLLSAVERSSTNQPGFFDGLHGVAHTLQKIGREKEALHLIEQIDPTLDQLTNPNLFGGLSGIALNLLHFARVKGDSTMSDRAVQLAERVAETVASGRFPQAGGTRSGAELGLVRKSKGPAGLMHGWSGPALLMLRMYEHIGDNSWLDAAFTASHLDLDRCRVSSFNTLNVDEGWRLNPYIETGAAGVAIVGSELLRHRKDGRLLDALEAARNTCAAGFFVQPSLWNGRVGQMVALQYITGPTDSETIQVTRRHLERLSWHQLGLHGDVVFPGFQLMRISMDYATGNAGILLGLKSALSGTASFLPFLRQAHQES